jgi:hypothetical protein
VAIGEAGGVGQPPREEEPGRDLRVEGLRRRHRHLHVATVGRVEHAVALVDEIAVAAVDDRDDRRPPRPHEIDGSVRVGRRSRLADRHDERVAHVVAEREPGQLGRGHRARADRRTCERLLERRGHRLAGDGGRALPRGDHLGDLAVGEALRDVGGHGVVGQPHREAPPLLHDLPPQRLADRRRCLADLLEQVVRRASAIDVARGDLGRAQVVVGDRELRSVEGQPADARERPGAVATQLDDLPVRPVAAVDTLAVHPQVARRLLDQPVGLAGDDEAVLGQTDVERLA